MDAALTKNCRRSRILRGLTWTSSDEKPSVNTGFVLRQKIPVLGSGRAIAIGLSSRLHASSTSRPPNPLRCYIRGMRDWMPTPPSHRRVLHTPARCASLPRPRRPHRAPLPGHRLGWVCTTRRWDAPRHRCGFPQPPNPARRFLPPAPPPPRVASPESLPARWRLSTACRCGSRPRPRLPLRAGAMGRPRRRQAAAPCGPRPRPSPGSSPG